jgi:hypothetical protein
MIRPKASPLEHPWASTTAQDTDAAANNTASRFILDSPQRIPPCRPARWIDNKNHITVGSGANRVTRGKEKKAKRKKGAGVTVTAPRRILIGYG